MYEKRKSKRIPINLELQITSLFKQDNKVIDNINEGIEVHNLSKTGMGFKCKQQLPLDYYFDAKIELSKDKFFYGVLKIVRHDALEDGYFIGCEFVGLAEIMSKAVDEYSEEMV